MNIDKILCWIVDQCFAIYPQPIPECVPKIVSHRGVHDNIHVFENTITAFDKAMKYGAWGIELDVRFTKDAHPVVIHDIDCKRLFYESVKINEMTLSEVKERFSLIPTIIMRVKRYQFCSQVHISIQSFIAKCWI